MNWVVVNTLILSSPFLLLWGWVKYLQDRQRSDWRSRASLVGLSAPLISAGLWFVMLAAARANERHTSNPVVHRLTTLGICIPFCGMLVGFAGRRLLIFAIVPASIVTVLFWYGTALH